MSRYVISDLHLDHANIIEYCNRPFDSVAEMNETLIENWNSVVDPEDTVVVVGDLVMGSHETALEFAEQLHGSILLVDGNHDSVDADRAPFPVVDGCELSVGKYRVYCTHRPENAPDDADWVVYGHHHNNDLYEYPFMDIQRNRVNVSVEVLDYTPLSFERLVELLDTGENYRQLPEY